MHSVSYITTMSRALKRGRWETRGNLRDIVGGDIFVSRGTAGNYPGGNNGNGGLDGGINYGIEPNECAYYRTVLLFADDNGRLPRRRREERRRLMHRYLRRKSAIPRVAAECNQENVEISLYTILQTYGIYNVRVVCFT